MFYYTYILQSLKDNSLYIGFTSDLKERIRKHNSGKKLATKPFIPYKIIFYEAFLYRIDAKNREKYLKSGYGRKTIKILLNNSPYAFSKIEIFIFTMPCFCFTRY